MFKFYANINGTNEGPFTLEELKELASKKKITPSTYVIIEGTEDWLAAKDVEGLFPAGPKLPNLPPPPPGDAPLSSEDAARIARQGAAAAKQGAQMAMAYGATLTSKSTGFWGGVIAFIKKNLNEGLISRTISALSQAGIYAMVLAALAMLCISALMAIQNSEYSIIGLGLFLVFLTSLVQYFASRFMDSGERIISATPTRMGSDALIEAIALITFLIAGVALAIGVGATLNDSGIWPAMVGIAVFLCGLLVVGISINPNLLNIKIGESSSAGEEAIGVISFGFKSWLRAIPAIFGILTVTGSLQLVWAFFQLLGKEREMASSMGISGAIMVLCGGLYPLIGLLYFLFSYLLIDLIAAILSIPRKLESLAKND